MVVGEPSLMGGEFGDEDERLITRLENSQYETGQVNKYDTMFQDTMFAHGPTFAVRETDVSRHQGGPIEGPPEIPRTSQH